MSSKVISRWHKWANYKERIFKSVDRSNDWAVILYDDSTRDKQLQDESLCTAFLRDFIDLYVNFYIYSLINKFKEGWNINENYELVTHKF